MITASPPLNGARLYQPNTSRHAVLRNLERPLPWRYWTDLLASATLGWAGAALACSALSEGVWGFAVVGIGIASLAVYRAAMFIHEISHLRVGSLPGFTFAWNALVGVPVLLPSFMYVGVHKFHHKADTYGTVRDPEYVPLAGLRTAIAVSTLVSLLLPLAVLWRFLVMAPIGLLIPPCHRWLERRASALAMNVRFEREVAAAERREMRVVELAILLLWSTAVAAAALGHLPWHAFAVWYAVTALACLLNHMRALAAHGYDNHAGTPMTRQDQLADSIDTPGGLWTELWAPLGLRYHALHHDFPGIPYHNLAEAYRRLQKCAAADRRGPRSSSPGLWASLRRLWSNRNAKGSYPHGQPQKAI